MRAFLTGCGAVSPFGGGVEAFWSALCAGRTAIAPLRGFSVAGLDRVLAAEVPAGAVDAHLTGDERSRLERIDQHALAATREALADAGLDLAACDPHRVAVVVGTTLGAMPIGER